MAVWATTEAVVGSLLLWVLLSGLARWALGFPWAQAIPAGFVAMLGHWLVGLAHHYGHFLAARRTGHPMAGVLLGRFLVLGTSVYPADEPPLPGRVHLRRALGGFPLSLILSLILLGAAWLLAASGPIAFWLLLFAGAESLVVYGVGSLLPLGFTDGSTIWRYWSSR